MANHNRKVLLIVLELARQGWTWRKSSNHWVLYPADKNRQAFAVSSSPSDGYGLSNAIKQIRKAGGQVRTDIT